MIGLSVGLNLMRRGGGAGGVGNIEIAATDDGEVTFTTSSSGATLTVVVTAPVAYAGSYDVTLSDLATGPVNIFPPSVSGTLGDGETLTSTLGLWVYDGSLEAPVIVREWYRNPATTDPDSGILLATAATYDQVTADLYQGIRYVETATQSFGERVEIVAVRATPAPALLFAGSTWGARYEIYPDTVATNSDGTGTVAVDGPVGWLRDLSGNGLHLTAAAEGNRPVLRNSGSLYWLEFTPASSHWLRASTGSKLSANDLFMCACRGLTTTLSGTAQLLGLDHTTGASQFVERTSGNRAEFVVRHLAGTVNSIAGQTTAVDTDPHVFTGRATSEVSTLFRIDGTQVAITESVGDNIVFQDALVFLGGNAGNYGPYEFYGGVISEVLPSTDTLRDDIETYYGNLGGITI